MTASFLSIARAERRCLLLAKRALEFAGDPGPFPLRGIPGHSPLLSAQRGTPDRYGLAPAAHGAGLVTAQILDQGRGLDSAAVHGADEVITHHQRGAGLARETLEPARHVHGVAQDRIFEPARIADVADQHLAVMQPDADRDRLVAGPLPLGVLAPDLGDHLGRAGKRPHRIVLLRPGRPEMHHDRVADILVDGAVMGEDNTCQASVKLAQQCHQRFR